jgi:hypothetical protein
MDRYREMEMKPTAASTDKAKRGEKVFRVIGSNNRAITVLAKTPYKAAVAAVKTGRFKAMGHLLRVETAPPTVAWYVSSIEVCKDAGMWRE